jgi:hypothetical protein
MESKTKFNLELVMIEAFHREYEIQCRILKKTINPTFSKYKCSCRIMKCLKMINKLSHVVEEAKDNTELKQE